VTPRGAIYKPHIFDFDGRACKKGGFLQAGGIKLKIIKNIFFEFSTLMVGPVKKGGFYRPGVSNSKSSKIFF
jgi:hypothetical protein